MYTIDNILMKDLGLHVSSHKGHLDHTGLKNMFFTIYKNEGYQITKRKGNVLQLHGFIMAHDLFNFKLKISQLTSILSQTGTRNVVFSDKNETIECFAKDGFQISKVRVSDNIVIGLIQLNLTVVNVFIKTKLTSVFSSQFNSVFGSPTITEQLTGIFSSAFNQKFN